jgi:twitching motility two-component system response regulator PilH
MREGRPDMAQRTVLIIEDSPTERAMVRDCLQGAGYTVLEAGDGAEAHARLAAAPFAAIVLDLILPDVNGYDLFRELQADTRTQATPVVMLTRRITMPEEYYGRTLGAAAYLKKPFQPAALLDEMQRLAPLS